MALDKSQCLVAESLIMRNQIIDGSLVLSDPMMRLLPNEILKQSAKFML